MRNKATIYWIRRDLRLVDNLTLVEAINRGGPVIPVVINDDIQCGLGAASAYRMSMGFEAIDKKLRTLGSCIIYRSGNPVDVLTELVRETGAGAVYWSRLYDPESVARDTKVKATLKADGIDAKSVSGHLMLNHGLLKPRLVGFSVCTLRSGVQFRGVMWRHPFLRQQKFRLPTNGHKANNCRIGTWAHVCVVDNQFCPNI